MVPTVLVAIPFTVLVSFTINILLREIGAADLSGAGAALGTVTQVGPHRHSADRRRAAQPPSARIFRPEPSAKRSTP